MPELRKDPIIGRWVIISTERAKRPDDFKKIPVSDHPDQGSCPFCAGREEMTPPEIYAIRNPDTEPNKSGWKVRVVPSVSPFLGLEGGYDSWGVGIYDVLNGFGAHEVVIETPEHIGNMTDLDTEQILNVLKAYRERIIDLEKDERMKYVLVYKNYGKQAGGSKIYHARSNIIGTPVVPKRVKEELEGARVYYSYHDRCVFCDILRQEKEQEVRLVYENENVISLCPFASRFPFETWILPKRHNCDFHTSSDEELTDVARALKIILSKLKKGLKDPHYNYMLHIAPFKRRHPGYWTTIYNDYHWHIEVIPRLTRIAGFEWGSGFYICPTPPEDAAKFLRELEI